MKRIYTLGTSLRSLKEFMEIINSYSIEAVIDVRSFPTSKLDHFKKTNLERLLKEEMFEYHHLGPELGGFREGGYENYTHSKEFESGIDRVEEIAVEKTSVILCAERFPWKCHRRFIARALQKRGWVVEHIIDKDRLWIPS